MNDCTPVLNARAHEPSNGVGFKWGIQRTNRCRIASVFANAVKAQHCCRMVLLPHADGKGDANNDDDSDESDDSDDFENELRYKKKQWLKNHPPELTVNTFHPTRANVMATSVAATFAANTVMSNHTSMTIGVNNRFGRERHQWTTTESPPSDLITRVMEYQKNITMYRQTVIQKRKNKERRKKKMADEDDSNEDENEDGDAGSEEGENETEDEGASSPPIDLLFMSVFLILYLYALHVLFSYHSELKLMSICNCDDNLGPRSKMP
ncbi:hypothetical protein QTP88_019001 [Uroleucon formosanum]